MFTKNEFFFFWLPGMLLGAILFAVMVGSGMMSTYTAGILEVLLGILLKFAARRINPQPPTQPESETANE